MKTLRILLFALAVMCINMACSSQKNDQDGQNDQQSTGQNEVSVYYFHFERRCVTCKAVESVSKEAIAELYDDDDVRFIAVNLDEDEGKETAKELGVSGQALLIIKGNKKIDLTSDAFMTAVNQPEELKNKLKENIDPLLL